MVVPAPATEGVATHVDFPSSHKQGTLVIDGGMGAAFVDKDELIEAGDRYVKPFSIKLTPESVKIELADDGRPAP